jgi:bifunctional DNA primase/polymerase-like protein
MSSIEAAKRLCSLGYQVVELKPRSKQPAGGPGWLQRAATHPSDIKGWRRNCNVGILGGSHFPDDRKLLVVDVDCKNGRDGAASLRRLQVDFGPLPRTASDLSPNHGRHLHLLVPDTTPLAGIAKVLDKAGYPGLDLIGDGLQVVVPPSAIPEGPYAWDVFPQEGISEAPSWLVSLLKVGGRLGAAERDGMQRKAIEEPLRHPTPRETTEEDQRRILDEIIQRFPVREAGQRDHSMHRAVGSLFGRGLDADVVRGIMLVWHEHYATLIGTPMPNALSALDTQIRYQIAKIAKGEFALCRVNHREAVSAWQLTEGQKSWLQNLGYGALPLLNIKERQNPSPRPSREPPLSHDGAFVECLLAHASYEFSKSAARGDSMLLTNQQIRDLMCDRHGIKLDATPGSTGDLRRLKRKFIAVGDRIASRRELLLLETMGQRGRASRYRLTGLAGAFATDPAACVAGHR